MNINLSEFSQLHRNWSEYNFPGQSPQESFEGMVEELGELAHARLKNRQGIRKGNIDWVNKEKDALGDMFIYWLDYCNRSGYDAEQIIKDTWDEIKDRDWREYPKNGRTE